MSFPTDGPEAIIAIHTDETIRTYRQVDAMDTAEGYEPLKETKRRTGSKGLSSGPCSVRHNGLGTIGE